MLTSVPQGPFENPKIDDGIYTAIIRHIIEGSYGDRHDDSTYFKIALELPEAKCTIVTNFYFRPGASKTPRRLWHFCSSVGLEPNDFFVQPDSFIGLPLEVTVETVQRDGVNLGCSYVDVARFLPAPTVFPESLRSDLEISADVFKD